MNKMINNSTSIGEGPKPLPFIFLNEDGGFSVNPEACQRLENIKGKLVVIVVAGLYRTGKSFLLSLLVKDAYKNRCSSSTSSSSSGQQGFAVGGTVQACTKGIWIWGEPIILEDGTNVLFLDTEGLGSVDGDQTHDTRIFALALLLASSFIYNSRGVIDGNAIDDLSFVVNLSKHIQTSSSFSSSTEVGPRAGDLHRFFPSFLWVVRDFTLQLQENGKKISSKQYLETALKPQGGFSQDVIAKDQIRLLLTDFFRQRDCVTLVRPVDDEQLLKKLPQIAYENLRSEFRSSFETMSCRLFEKAKPKMLYGKMLDGFMFVKLVQSYVEALNNGKAPVITNAWHHVVKAQREDALQHAIESYTKEIHSHIQPLTSVEEYFLLQKKKEEEEEEEAAANGQQQQQEEEEEEATQNKVMFDENGNLCTLRIQDVFEEEEDVEEEDEEEEEGEMDKTYRLPCQENQLAFLHKKCKQKAKQKLRQEIMNKNFNEEKETDVDADADVDVLMGKFHQNIQEIYASIQQQNAQASMTYCCFLLDQMRTTAADSEHFLTLTLTQLYQTYIQKAIGPSQDEAFCNFWQQKILKDICQTTEKNVFFHLEEIRQFDNKKNELNDQLINERNQVKTMKNFLLQQQKNNELIIKQTKEKAEKEIFVLEQQLEMKTKQLELVLHHQGTLQNLVDIAQQGEEYTITEFISSSCTQMAGYLIKQQQNQIKNTSGCGSVFLKSQNNYQQQYFVLQGTQLSFYDTKKHFEKNPNESSPMEMKGAKIEDTFVVPEAFCIIFSEETNHESFVIHLHAKSVQVKKEWVDRLRRAATGRPGSFISSLPQDNNSQYRSNPPSPISTSLAPDGDDKPSGLLLSKASPNKAELYQANDTSEDNNFQQ